MAFEYMLLAAQAAGIGLNLYQQRRAARIENLGYDLDREAMRLQQSELDLRMKQEGLMATEEAMFATDQLKTVMASQRALFAARGQATGVGSAGSIEAESLDLFNQDNRARSITQGFRQQYLKSQKNLIQSNITQSRIDQLGKKAQRHADLMSMGVNMFSFNALNNQGAKTDNKTPDPFELSKQSGVKLPAWKNPNKRIT